VQSFFGTIADEIMRLDELIERALHNLSEIPLKEVVK